MFELNSKFNIFGCQLPIELKLQRHWANISVSVIVVLIIVVIYPVTSWSQDHFLVLSCHAEETKWLWQL